MQEYVFARDVKTVLSTVYFQNRVAV